jgi:hypothetical protein
MTVRDVRNRWREPSPVSHMRKETGRYADGSLLHPITKATSSEVLERLSPSMIIASVVFGRKIEAESALREFTTAIDRNLNLDSGEPHPSVIKTTRISTCRQFNKKRKNRRSSPSHLLDQQHHGHSEARPPASQCLQHTA